MSINPSSSVGTEIAYYSYLHGPSVLVSSESQAGLYTYYNIDHFF